MFHEFTAQYRYYFNVHTFIGQQINKRSFEDWKLCRHNIEYPGKAVSLVSDVMEMKEMKDIPIYDYMKTRWIDLYHKMTMWMTQIFNIYVPVITAV